MTSFNNVLRYMWVPAVIAMGFFVFSILGNGVEKAEAFDIIITPKVCNITVDTSQVQYGGSVTVSWNTSGYDSITVNDQSVSATGQQTFHNITVDTIYRLRAETNDGNHVCNQSVSVTCLQPVLECTMSGNPIRINQGDSAVLTWTTTNADAASIDQGIGAVSLNGNTSVSPAADTTYTLTATRGGDSVQCPVTIEVTPVVPDPTCTMSGSPLRINEGESATLTWTTTNADAASIDRGIGAVSLNGNTTVSPTTNTTYTLTATGNGTTVTCPVTIEVTPVVPDPVCTLTADPIAIMNGQSSVLTWTTQNADTVSINQGIGAVSLNGNTTVSPTTNTTYTLTATGNGTTVTCPVTITVSDVPPALACTINADPLVINRGETSTITWQSVSAVSAVIDQAVGIVPLNGNVDVSPADTTTYTLTVADANGRTEQCPVTITVQDLPDPVCSYFTVTPDVFNNGVGGQVTLDWEVRNADTVSIDQGIGVVAHRDTHVTSVTDTTTYTLTATGNGTTITCPATVTVNPVTPTLSCDSFSASPSSLPRGGGDTTLTWETTGATSVEIDNGVGSVAVDGSETVSVGSDTTYTLTARDASGTSVTCTTYVDVDTGGGGGGSSPKCDLDISDTKIKLGEEVTITWKNKLTNDMILEDNRGNVLVDTKKSTKYDEDEGSITVKPTKDTEYTMTVFRGSRDRTCKVEVELEDEVTVISKRNQEPQVAGISLSQVPYTGFEAGPLLTFVFYSVLALWAAFVAYVLIMRDKPVMGIALGGTPEANEAVTEWETTIEAMPKDLSRPVEKTVKASTATLPTDVPFNLPTEVATAVMGYQNSASVELDVNPMTELENVAHSQSALLSSDAIQFFMDAYDNEAERVAALKETIATAKAKYPAEGGWLVLNRERVNELRQTEALTTVETPSFIPETRVGASSLAEAVVTGNAKAAIDMIGSRPMFSLADAVADLDGIYRARKGVPSNASDLLIEATKNITDEQIEAMISALTSALDGAYNDEQAAVKMAIMKASQVVR